MKKRVLMRTLMATAVIGVFATTAWSQSGQPVKIGVLATLEGPFAAGGADGMRGAELAIRERGGVVAGRKIEMIKASSDAKPDVAVNSARKLSSRTRSISWSARCPAAKALRSRITRRRSRR